MTAGATTRLVGRMLYVTVKRVRGRREHAHPRTTAEKTTQPCYHC